MNLWTRRKPKRLVKTKKRRPSLSRLLLLDTIVALYIYSLSQIGMKTNTYYIWMRIYNVLSLMRKKMYSYLYLYHVFKNPAVIIEKKFDKSGKFFFYDQTIVLQLHIFLTLMLSWLAHGQTKYNVFGYVHNSTSRWCF